MIPAAALVFLVVGFASHSVEANCFYATIEHEATQVCDNGDFPKGQIYDEESLRIQGPIAVLPANAFQGLSFFKKIRMIGAGLTDIHPGAFNGLSDTEFLNLANNKLQKVKAGTFSSMKALKILRLEMNEISDLEDGCFDGLVNLETLKLYRNKIPKLTSGMFSIMTSLTDTNLAGNAISVIEPGSFNGLSNLKDLILAYNNLISLPDNNFSGLVNLYYINLSMNKLVSFPSAVTSLTTLKRLDIMSNAITSLPQPWPLPKLQDLYFPLNKITTVPGDLFKGTNIKRFGGFGNPFVCDCHLEGFYTFVTEMSQKKGLFRHSLKDYKCKTPNEHSKKTFVDITAQELRSTGNCN